MEVLSALEECEDERLKARVEQTIATVERTLDLYG